MWRDAGEPGSSAFRMALPFSSPPVSSVAPSSLPSGLADPPQLDASGITKRYGHRLVLDDVSLSVSAGEAVAIIGENGAGKSTLLSICAGLTHPDSGDVSVHGRVGFCPQQPGLFDLLSAEEHLALFAPALGLSRSEAVDQGHALLAEFAFPTRRAHAVQAPVGRRPPEGQPRVGVARGRQYPVARRALSGLRPRLLRELLGAR
jgi:ABC-2 type transport system ATP-binding protein